MSENKALVLGERAGLLGDVIDAIHEEQQERKRKLSQEDMVRNAITALLGQLGGLTVQDDALTYQGERFIIPASYEGKPISQIIDFFVNYDKQQSQTFNYSRTMPYRPYDGAYAFMRVMKEITGTEGFGVTKWTIFGPHHPEFKSINIDHDTIVQVPWGEVSFPTYNAEFAVGAVKDAEKGVLFTLSCTAPRKYRKHIEAIFRLVEQYLNEHSIYRGKAIDGAMYPDYLNLSLVDPSKVVYSGEVLEQLAANVWAPIEYSETMRAADIPLKRAVLFAGPFGTGKSLGGLITAQRAVANDWTFIMCRTGKDDPATVLRTAELYAPAVVFIEDVDVHTEGGSHVDISRMLDMLDGITSKGVEVVAVFTTNYLERIQKGALRPGRIDAVIEISDLDEAGFKKLVSITVGEERLSEDIDWGAVAVAFQGFLPAFVVEAARRSIRYSISRNNGVPGIMGTSDLVFAADTLRPQLERMEGAKEGANRRHLGDEVRDIVEGVVRRSGNDMIGQLQVEEATLLNGAKQ